MSVNKRALLCALSLILLMGCHPRSCLLEPQIAYSPNQRLLQTLPSAFDPLSPEELSQDWGKEMKIGLALAREWDFYRAITAFKRATILMPGDLSQRRLQTEFSIFQSYWLGCKYCDAIDQFENGPLHTVTGSFPSFREMLIILYDSYRKTEQNEKACVVLTLMEQGDPKTAQDLKLLTVLEEGDLSCLLELAQGDPAQKQFEDFERLFCGCAKSVRTAQILNALLPGAGYYYVGQKRSALTSFLINVAFASTTYVFFKERNWGAAAIAGSLEFGWYFGGINGAGLAAKEYNQKLYENLGKELMLERRLFPVLMLETSF